MVCPPIAIRMRSVHEPEALATLPSLRRARGPAPPSPRAEPGPRLSRRLRSRRSRGACAERPLAEKVLVAPSLFVGTHARRAAGARGPPWMNLRVETVRTLASPLVGAGPRPRGAAPAVARAGARARRAGLRRGAPTGGLLRRAARPARLPPRAPAHARGAARRRASRPRALPAEGASRTARKREELRAVLAALRRARSRRRAGSTARGAPPRARGARPGAGAAATPSSSSRADARALGASSARSSSGSPAAGSTTLDDRAAGRLDRRARRGRALFRAIGEENEIREVFRRVPRGRHPVRRRRDPPHRRRASTPALALGDLARARDPVHVRRRRRRHLHRPGQAALAFLDWIAGGLRGRRAAAGPRLGRADASRLATRRRAAGPPAPGRAGCRAARGSAGARRGICAALDRLVAELERPRGGAAQRRRGRGRAPRNGRGRRARRLAAARPARDFVRARARARAARRPDGASCDLARGARETFVTEFARVADDARRRRARRRSTKLLAELEDASPRRPALGRGRRAARDAVRGLSVESGPRRGPAASTSADFAAGGYSGRGARFPRRARRGAASRARTSRTPSSSTPSAARSTRRSPAPRSRSTATGPASAARALQACVARLRGRRRRRATRAGNCAASTSRASSSRRRSSSTSTARRAGSPSADYTRLLAGAAARPPASSRAPPPRSTRPSGGCAGSAGPARPPPGAAAPPSRALYP